MKRPSIHDKAIIEAAAERWATERAGAYPDFTGGNEAWFADLLSEATERRIMPDASDVAADLSRKLSCNVDEDLLDLCEDFLATLRTVHRETVERWATGWGPKAPFSNFSRVTVTGRGGKEACGIANPDSRYAKTAEFLFVSDDDLKASTDTDGFIRSWQVLQFEDVTQTSPLTRHDFIAVSAHVEADRHRELGYATSRRARKAKKDFQDLVKAARPTDDTAAQVYRQLAKNPEEAAAIVAALTAAAVSVIENRPETDDQPTATAGMLL